MDLSDAAKTELRVLGHYIHGALGYLSANDHIDDRLELLRELGLLVAKLTVEEQSRHPELLRLADEGNPHVD